MLQRSEAFRFASEVRVTKADLEAENVKLKAELAKLHGRSRSPCRADIVADSTPSRRAEALGFVPAISPPNPFLLHGSHRLFGLVALQIGLHQRGLLCIHCLNGLVHVVQGVT